MLVGPMSVGFIIGIGAGLWLSFLFIFPADILNLKLANITIGDLLRILGGVVVTVIGGVYGAFLMVILGVFSEEALNWDIFKCLRKKKPEQRTE